MDERWQEIERIYHAALEREKSARPACLVRGDGFHKPRHRQFRQTALVSPCYYIPYE
jgi:hypothetical protein